MRWHFDIDPDMQIAVSVALHILNAFALEPEHGAGLRPRWNPQRSPAIEHGYRNLGAQSGLDEIDRHFAEQIVTIALKDFVRFDVQDDVKIARGPTTQAGLAVSRRSQTRPGINPSWNAQLDLRGLLLSAGAAA